VCIALCTIVAHNTAQNRPDNFPSYPPDNHHGSDDVYLRERRPNESVTVVKTSHTNDTNNSNTWCQDHADDLPPIYPIKPISVSTPWKVQEVTNTV